VSRTTWQKHVLIHDTRPFKSFHICQANNQHELMESFDDNDDNDSEHSPSCCSNQVSRSRKIDKLSYITTASCNRTIRSQQDALWVDTFWLNHVIVYLFFAAITKDMSDFVQVVIMFSGDSIGCLTWQVPIAVTLSSFLVHLPTTRIYLFIYISFSYHTAKNPHLQKERPRITSDIRFDSRKHPYHIHGSK